MDKFEGNPNTFRRWFFDLKVAVGSVDKELAQEMDRVARYTFTAMDKTDLPLVVDTGLHEKYASELYIVVWDRLFIDHRRSKIQSSRM